MTDLGNDVYRVDTRMAGYQGITAGYLIRSSRSGLVETGPSPSRTSGRGGAAATVSGIWHWLDQRERPAR